jgi:hypothetical protein
LIRRLQKSKRKAHRATDDDIPSSSSTQNYVLSKPWKETRVARNWMITNQSDKLFDVSSFFFVMQTFLITLLGICLETQKACIDKATGSR